MSALRARAETLAAPLPPLLARADRLATSVLPGGHGRRRAGQGEAFWQFRPAIPGEPAGRIDWRRSARGDESFVRQTEWEAPQTVLMWCDRARSMTFAEGGRPPKADRARLLSLALAILLLKGGERVGLLGTRAAAGRAVADRLARELGEASEDDYGSPPAHLPPRGAKLVLVSDFLGDPAPVLSTVGAAANAGATGVLLQILDPAEEAFPYRGRTLFRSMAGAVRFDTRSAADLKADYEGRLADRRAALREAARRTGWSWRVHRTDAPAGVALRALWQDVAGRLA